MAIQIKRSNTSGNVPSSLAFGELALNTADQILFWGAIDGTVHSLPFSTAAILAGAALTGLPTAPDPYGASNARSQVQTINGVVNFISQLQTTLPTTPGILWLNAGLVAISQ